MVSWLFVSHLNGIYVFYKIIDQDKISLMDEAKYRARKKHAKRWKWVKGSDPFSVSRNSRDHEIQARSRSFGKMLAWRDRAIASEGRGARGERREADARDKDPSFIREIKSARHYPEVYPRENAHAS